MRQVDIYPLRKRDQKYGYRFPPNYRNFLLMVFRNISKINGADTLTPSEITLKATLRIDFSRHSESRAWAKLCVDMKWRGFQDLRENVSPSYRATRINSNFPISVPTIPLGEGGPRTKDHGFPAGDMSMIKPQLVS